ncbi:hypothetical protein B1H10_04755 [candidate division KSB1 bacterium 4484_188]|nr:MAG: hypothetical protein B1H10_04755 [candidate division KSB1 bacterium 4484_188]
MLEQVIENIINKIRKEVVSAQMEYIPLNYLMTRNIPDSVKHFFDQEVEIWLREEAEKFTANERFDYDMPEVRVLIDKLFDILKSTATFHINKFNQLLERAIKLEANYLTRPHQTLTQFLFKDSFLITTMDVYDMLKYFDKFQYYKDALTDYFNLKYLREISQMVKIIITFMNEGREPSDSLSTEVLLQSFKDRNLDDYAALIQAEENEGTEKIDVTELEALLRTGKTAKQRRRVEAEKEEISVEEIADIETAKPEIQVEEITVKAEAKIPEPEVEEVEEEEYEEEEAVPAESMTAADQLANMVAAKIKGDSLEDLENLIPRKMRKKIIKRIFKKNESQYTQFTEFINQVPTWKQASAAIDEMFYQTGINPYSRDALEFSDLIYNRYFPKDRKVNREEIM